MVKKQDDIPKWVVDEIKNAKFGKPKELTRTGYILEIYLHLFNFLGFLQQGLGISLIIIK